MNKFGYLFLALLVFTYFFIHYKTHIAPRRKAVKRCVEIKNKIRYESLQGYAEIPYDFSEFIGLLKKYQILPQEIGLPSDLSSFAAEVRYAFDAYVLNQVAMHSADFGGGRQAVDALKKVQELFNKDFIQPILEGRLVLYLEK